MSSETVCVGQTFEVACDTTDPDTGEATLTLGDYTDLTIHYRRPDGYRGTIEPDSNTDTVAIGTITTTLNPASVSSGPTKWRDGYSGTWEFRLACNGSGSTHYLSRRGYQVVEPMYRNPA